MHWMWRSAFAVTLAVLASIYAQSGREVPAAKGDDSSKVTCTGSVHAVVQRRSRFAAVAFDYFVLFNADSIVTAA
jgi:hypothetical protein